MCFSILLISHAIHLTNVDRMSSCSDGKNSQVTLRFTHVLKYLAELDLQGNVLTKLPDSVSEMKHLTSINLANNKFSIFPDKLTEIATLERIDLQGNSLTGKKELLMYPLCEKGTYLHISVFLSFKFSSTEVPLEKLSDMPSLKWLNVKSNPLDSNTKSDLQSPHKFDILSTAES